MSTARPAAKKKVPAPRTAYLVLGVHRSGTSAIAQLLGLAGANLPQNMMAGDEHNQQGYFESWKIAVFNDEWLMASDSSWNDVFSFPFRPLPETEARDWLQRGAALFSEEYGKAGWPLLKDPRVTVLLPFWKAILADLGIAARCVITVRHPLAVAGSLKHRDGYQEAHSLLLWCAYMLAAEAYSRDLPRAFVGYEALLNDWRGQVTRIETAHGAPLPKMTKQAARQIDQFLSPDLRHNAAEGDLTALGWPGELTARVFSWFEAAAAGDEPNRGLLDAAADNLAKRLAEVGILVTPLLADARRQFKKDREQFKKDREVLEAGWTRDVRRLETEARRQFKKDREQFKKDREQFKKDREVLEAGWTRDVRRLETEARKAIDEIDALLAGELDA